MRSASSAAAILTLALTTATSVAYAQDDLERLPASQQKAYKVIKPTSADLKWRQIPWLTDLAEGIKLAKAEKRPLLIWTSGDEPLERC